MNKEIQKHRFLEGFGVVVIILALIRCAFPGLTSPGAVAEAADSLAVDSVVQETQTAQKAQEAQESQKPQEAEAQKANEPQKAQNPPKSRDSYEFYEAKSQFATRYVPDGDRYHRILSVPSYSKAFPDSNNVQLTAARYWGVKPVKNRRDAEARKSELVYVGFSPYYYIDPLYSSIPYLTPRAAILLQDIGQAFFDSLQVKGVPLHKFIVTSVLRTEEDVAKLRRHNGNATENSCHLFGTTFDITYTRYKVVEDPDGPHRRTVRDDSLKYILSEVLNDMRKQKRCYIKYEVKQACFHMTVR